MSETIMNGWDKEPQHKMKVNPDGSINANSDYSGKQSSNTIFNETLVGNKETDILVQFQYNISDHDVTTELVDTGTVTQETHMVKVSSGTGTSAEAHVISVESLRYRPGHEAFAYFTNLWETKGLANSIQYIGPLNDDDGFFIGYTGTDFSCGHRKDTVDTVVTQSDFNKDKLDGTGTSEFNLNQNNLNIFKVTFGWLGIAPAFFEVYGGANKGWILFHVIDFPNTQTGISIGNPVTPVHIDIIKSSADATDLIMRSGSWSAGVIDGGSGEVGKRFHTADNSQAIIANVDTNVLTLRNKATFASKTNRVLSKLQYISGDVDGTKPVAIKVCLNPDLSGTPVWTDVEINNSVIEYSITDTIVSGGTLLMPFHLKKDGDLNELIKELELHLHPGNTMSLSALSTGASTVDFALRWEERF